MKMINYDCGCKLKHCCKHEEGHMHWCFFHEPGRMKEREKERLRIHYAFEDANNPLSLLFNIFFR